MIMSNSTRQMMYFLLLEAVPTADHPEHDRIGAGFISCWIEHESIEEAIATAKSMIVEQNWRIVQTELVQLVTETDYEEEDEHRQYFEQALIDKTVFCFNCCPRHPVYLFHFALVKNDGPSEARVWILNESVDEEHDHMDPEFWSGERVARAESITAAAIADQGFQVKKVLRHGPCSREDTPDDVKYYDDAEEDGLCIVFRHDQQ